MPSATATDVPPARRPLCLVCFGAGRPFVPELAARLAPDFEVYRFDLAAGRVYHGEALWTERDYGERHRTAALTLWRHRDLLRRAVIHYHFTHPLYWLARVLSAPSRSIVHFWGSDIWRAGPLRHRVQRAFLRGMAHVVAPATATSTAVAEQYGLRHVPVWQLGIGSLDEIAERLAAGPPVAKDTICIGYNGFREQQHLRILEAAAEPLRQLRSAYRIVIPMTYGAPAGYVDDVTAACATHGLDVEVVTAFIPQAELVELRARTALMLHFPVSDAFSASMQEVLVGGGVVLAGDWLDYGELDGTGAQLRQVGWSGLREAVAALSTSDDALAQDAQAFAKTGNDAVAPLPTEARLIAPLLERSSWRTWLPTYTAAYTELGA